MTRYCLAATFLALLTTALVQSTEDLDIDAQAQCLDAANSQTRPNILFILMDDLGWGDLSATSGQFPTPNMDAVYTSGIQLSHHYIHLMCSPSRTQFLTGRYAMNLGYGEFIPWDDAEIGGIPIGQPTIANWLRDFGSYHTYGVGKWQLGYASTQLTPRAKGFEHFYGFYQGAIDYVTKTYNDIVYGDIGVYDFFEDEKACYAVIESAEDTMSLYSAKIIEYLEAESALQTQSVSDGEVATPFYLLASLQSLHVPLPVLPQFTAQCAEAVPMDMSVLSLPEQAYLRQRRLYCGLTLKTDEVIGEIMDTLRREGLYENTLIVFTADNGGETDRGASNFPFRGTKGELYEGNTRTLTAVTGGVIEKKGLKGMKSNIVSNLDWTPTLLSLAGYLDCIDEADRTWDGVDQMPMLLGEVKSERDALVLNVGDDGLLSARILVRVDGKLFKYAKSDAMNGADRWIYSDRLSDVWTQPSYYESGVVSGINVIDYDETKTELMYSQVFEDRFLFDLSSDESEKYNLLNPEVPHFDGDLNDAVSAKAEALLSEWMARNKGELFSAPIDGLHERLKAGEPQNMADGKFVRPFLSHREYSFMVEKMLADEAENVPERLKELYLVPWVSPTGAVDRSVEISSGLVVDDMMVAEEMSEVAEAVMDVSLLLPIGLAALAVLLVLCGIWIYYCLRKRAKDTAPDRFRERLVRVGVDEESYNTFIE